MKKLMLLGGSRYLRPVIKAAHDLGIYVITVDYLPDNYAHKLSDEYLNISIIDRDAVLKAAEENRIDGIMSFACDPGVVTAAFVAEKMGLPNVGPYESVKILQNKGLFRQYLKDNGFNVPKFTVYKKGDLIKTESYPVIVKPTDSAGSKGVSRADRKEELQKAVEVAFRHSLCGEIIIEEIIEAQGYASDSDCFSIDGMMDLVTFNSQFFDKNAANPYTPAAFCWPSLMDQDHQEELKRELQRLITLLGMKTAVYNVETRVDKQGKCFLMEVSPRGGGNRLAECIKYATGRDMITDMVKYSVGEEFNAGVDREIGIEGKLIEVVIHSDGPGIFRGLELDDYVKEHMIEKDIWVNEGDVVNPFTGANESIGTIIMRPSENEKADELIENISSHVRVLVEAQ